MGDRLRCVVLLFDFHLNDIHSIEYDIQVFLGFFIRIIFFSKKVSGYRIFLCNSIRTPSIRLMFFLKNLSGYGGKPIRISIRIDQKWPS